jgi:superfamily I DNA/RNA helicase
MIGLVLVTHGRLAAEFIDDPEERNIYINQSRMAQIERETPLLYYSTDFNDEKRRLIEMLRIRLAKGERIGVLLPQKKQVFGFAEGLRAVGLEVETQDEMDFSTDLPKILTYHSAKGLTFDTVLLPRLVPGSFPGMHTRRIERLLFVAISRATKWVYMSTKNRSDFPIIDRLRSVDHRQWLTIQEGGVKVEPATASTADDLLDLL